MNGLEQCGDMKASIDDNLDDRDRDKDEYQKNDVVTTSYSYHLFQRFFF